MAIILRKFNMNYISDNALLLIIGLQHTGKSIIIKKILNNNNILAGLIVKNKFINNNKYDYISPNFIYNNIDFIKEFVKYQIKLIKNNNCDSRKFIIFDDNITKDDLKNKYLLKIFSNPYELNLLCILKTIILEDIYYRLLYKNKVDYIFILKNDIYSNRKKIYDSINNKINIVFTLFCKFLDDYTNNEGYCLIIYLKSESKNIEDIFFWYKI